MAGFDPDAYLAQKPAAAPAAFDPDAYLAAVTGGPRATGTMVDQIPGSSVKAPAATAAPERPNSGFFGKLMAPLETAVALGTSAITAPIVEGSKVYGALTSGQFGNQRGIKAGEETGRKVQQFFQPQVSPEAERQIATIGNALASTGLQGVPLNVLGDLQRGIMPATRAVTDLGGAKVAQRTERLAQEASAKDWQRSSKIDAGKAAREVGLFVDPAEVNPTLGTNLAVGAAGKSNVSIKNAKANMVRVNEIAREDLGLPKNTPLTAEAFEKARNAHSAPYDNIRKIGVMQASDDVLGELGGLKLDPLSTSTPEKAAKVNAVVDRVTSQVANGLSGDNVVGQIRGFRKDANQVLKNPNASPIDIDVAETNLKIANALENLVEANISDPKALSDFRKARTAIAKTYDWENATGVTTKQVDSAQLVKLAEKGKPLSGKLAQVAEVAGNFPKDFDTSRNYMKEAFQYLRRGGVGGSLGFLVGGPFGAAIGAGLTSLGSEGAARMLARPGVQNRLAMPADRRIPLPVEPQTPMAPIPQNRAVVPFDYSQQTFTPPNFTIVPEQYGPRVGPAPSPIEIQRGLPAPSAEGTMNMLRTEDARRAAMSRTLGQQAEQQAAAAEAANRRPTRGEVILDINPLTGVPEISKGLKGATPEIIESANKAAMSAAEKVRTGRMFDMTAAEKIQWNKSWLEGMPAEQGPMVFGKLTPDQIANKMQDRAFVQQAINTAQDKARAFQDIAARAQSERLRQDALMKREQMLDLLENLEGQFSKARPVKTGGQGPKTRAFQRNMLRPEGEEIQNALVK